MACRRVSALRRSIWAVAFAAVLCSATPSQAGVVLDFDLSASTLLVGNVILVANGMGATVTGSAHVQLDGVNTTGMITGTPSGVISSLTLNVALDTDFFRSVNLDARLVGPFRIAQAGMATGSFDGMALTVAPNGFTTFRSFTLDCVGPDCPVVETLGMITFPVTQSALVNNDQPFTFNLTGLSSQAMLNATLVSMNSLVPLTFAFHGREVRRLVSDPPFDGDVPEPLEPGLLLLGALAVLGRAAMRRPSSRQP